MRILTQNGTVISDVECIRAGIGVRYRMNNLRDICESYILSVDDPSLLPKASFFCSHNNTFDRVATISSLDPQKWHYTFNGFGCWIKDERYFGCCINKGVIEYTFVSSRSGSGRICYLRYSAAENKIYEITDRTYREADPVYNRYLDIFEEIYGKE